MNDTESKKYLWQAILIGTLLWVGVFSVWFTNNVYNKDNFVKVTTEALKSEAVRTAVADDLESRFSANYPILGRVAGPTLNKVFLGILDSNLFDRIYNRAAQSAYKQLTTNESTAVVINLKPATDFLLPVLQANDSQLTSRVESLPAEIILIPDRQLPNIGPQASLTVNFGQALGLVGVVLLIHWVWRAEKARRKFVKNLSIVVGSLSAVMFLSLASLRDFVVSQTTSSSGRVLVGELYNRFTVDLSNISILLTFVAFLTVVILSLYKRVQGVKSK